jgi:hypothetical protein
MQHVKRMVWYRGCDDVSKRREYNPSADRIVEVARATSQRAGIARSVIAVTMLLDIKAEVIVAMTEQQDPRGAHEDYIQDRCRELGYEFIPVG